MNRRQPGGSQRRCLDDCPPCADCCTAEAPAPTGSEARRLRRWAWWLTAATIAWNGLEAVTAIVSGVIAHSIALIGFGLDSVVETGSALIIVWRLTRQGPDQLANERAESRAVRLIALTFFGIAAYVLYDAVAKLLGTDERPDGSPVGLALVILSLIVMPALAWAKRQVASGLTSIALEADAAETQLCVYLSAVVLVGLAANALLGWWWMDPLAALVVAVLALREGRRAWINGELCGCGEETASVRSLPCPVFCCPTCPSVTLA